jgi:hypothetical protein
MNVIRETRLMNLFNRLDKLHRVYDKAKTAGFKCQSLNSRGGIILRPAVDGLAAQNCSGFLGKVGQNCIGTSPFDRSE